MDLFPLLLPPPGVVPNFVNPDNQNAEAISCVTICLTFMVLFVMMRLYAKTFISKSIGWDDCECLGLFGDAAALISVRCVHSCCGKVFAYEILGNHLIFMISLARQPLLGFSCPVCHCNSIPSLVETDCRSTKPRNRYASVGTDDWEIQGVRLHCKPLYTCGSNNRLTFHMQVVFIFAAGYGPVGFLVKLSVFLLYLRIFWVNKLVRVMTYVGISFAFLYHATATTLYFAFCWPRNNQKWMFSYMSPRCRYNGHLLSIILSVLNTVTDIYILCIPISAVMGLQMSSKRKIQAMIAFMTGSL